MGLRFVGLWNCKIVVLLAFGLQDRKNTGLRIERLYECRIVGVQDYLITRMQNCRVAGLKECRIVGLKELEGM